MVPDSPSSQRAPFPAQIGRHEIVCQLGEGGMARVYLAVQRGAFDAAKLVVVKQVRSEYATDPDFLPMFVDEARIAVRLNHPNVVHTYELVAESPPYALIMEYLEGQTLAKLLRRIGRETFPLDEHVWILSQILAGLGYAHELNDFDGTPLGIVHRDVSPSNVFVTTKGEVKLLDFGIAKAAGAVSFTQQGVIKGKLGYVAPEQYLSQHVDHRADLYSVGVMLWEAIAGRRRTTGDTQLATLRARLEASEPKLEAIAANAPPSLLEACSRALARGRDQRFGSAAEFQACLDGYLAETGRRNIAESVAKLLNDHFSDELGQLRRTIEAHASSMQLTSSRRLSLKGGPDVASVPATVSDPNTSASASSSMDFAAALKHSRKRSIILLALGGGLALAAGSFALTRPSADPPNAPAARAAAPPQTPLASSPTPAPVEAPRTRVQLVVSVSPSFAKLRLDGAPIDNPFVAQVPIDEREHELKVTAPGFTPVVRTLRFQHDLELKLVLNRDAAAERRAASVRSASPSERGDTLGSPSNTAPEPGADLKPRAGRRPARAIDDKDPY